VWTWAEERRALPLGDFWGTVARPSSTPGGAEEEYVLFVLERKTESNLLSDVISGHASCPGQRTGVINGQRERLALLTAEAARCKWSVTAGFLFEKNARDKPMPYFLKSYRKGAEKAAQGFKASLPANGVTCTIETQSCRDTFDRLGLLMDEAAKNALRPGSTTASYPTASHLQDQYQSVCFWSPRAANSSSLWMWMSSYPRMTDVVAQELHARLVRLSGGAECQSITHLTAIMRKKGTMSKLQSQPLYPSPRSQGALMNKGTLVAAFVDFVLGKKTESEKTLAVCLNRVRGVSYSAAKVLAREFKTIPALAAMLEEKTRLVESGDDPRAVLCLESDLMGRGVRKASVCGTNLVALFLG
jgi:hypothetical protein